MINFTTKIIKGIINRLSAKKSSSRFEKISFLREKILKHEDNTTIKKLKLNNFVLYYKNSYEVMHTYDELFQKEIYKFSSRDHPFIIDCGSNIGQSILYFKSIYPNSTILAFEADKNVYELLQKNISANNLSQVEAVNAAVWVTNDFISFNAKESEGSHIDFDNNIGDDKVPCRRFYDILRRYNKVDFLKIDIEGAEYPVITDAKDQLSKVENMFLEYHGIIEEQYKLTELLNIIEQSGFCYYIQNAADFLRHPFINKKTGLPYDLQLNIFCYRLH
jgi:FkbM family methyltransferase